MVGGWVAGPFCEGWSGTGPFASAAILNSFTQQQLQCSSSRQSKWNLRVHLIYIHQCSQNASCLTLSWEAFSLHPSLLLLLSFYSSSTGEKIQAAPLINTSRSSLRVWAPRQPGRSKRPACHSCLQASQLTSCASFPLRWSSRLKIEKSQIKIENMFSLILDVSY